MSDAKVAHRASQPQGPPTYLRLGHFLRFRSDILGFLLDCTRKYGDIVDLSLGPRTYLLNNPDDIRHVLLSSHDIYAKTRRLTGKRGRRFSGEGLLTSSGEAALNQRRLL
ncbi:MAG: cytochrome P450, partial [Schlesneria sp.]